MEIFGYHPDLKKWTEIGNSGMFRPEMLLPMGLPKASKPCFAYCARVTGRGRRDDVGCLTKHGIFVVNVIQLYTTITLSPVCHQRLRFNY